MVTDETPTPFTDEELSFLRHVRFGELPGRVPPEDRVEFVETEPGRPAPEVISDRPYPPPWAG